MCKLLSELTCSIALRIAYSICLLFHAGIGAGAGQVYTKMIYK